MQKWNESKQNNLRLHSKSTLWFQSTGIDLCSTHHLLNKLLSIIIELLFITYTSVSYILLKKEVAVFLAFEIIIRKNSDLKYKFYYLKGVTIFLQGYNPVAS